MMKVMLRTTALAQLLLLGCSEQQGAELVGNACLPESIPTGPNGRGFTPTESYLEANAAECGSDVCIVHRLDNGTDGSVPADPTVLCDDKDPKPGCLQPANVRQSVHCSCRCDGPGSREHYCTCPDNFVCREVVAPTGPNDVGGLYCVRPADRGLQQPSP